MKKWNRRAERNQVPEVVFCGSLCDIFDEHPDVTEWRKEFFAIAMDSSALDVLILTKRPQHVPVMAPPQWAHSWPSHVWLGVSVGHPDSIFRAYELLLLPVPIKVLSIEPYIKEVDFEPVFAARNEHGGPAIAMAIVGGTSGKTATPMYVSWVRRIKALCEQYGVHFHFKQWGEYLPECQMAAAGLDPAAYKPKKIVVGDDGVRYFRVGKSKAGHLLDGVSYQDGIDPFGRYGRGTVKTVEGRQRPAKSTVLEASIVTNDGAKPACGSCAIHDECAAHAGDPTGDRTEGNLLGEAVNLAKKVEPGTDPDTKEGEPPPPMPPDPGPQVLQQANTADIVALAQPDVGATSVQYSVSSVDGWPPTQLIHTAEGTVFALQQVGQRFEALPVNGSEFRDQVQLELAQQYGKPPSQAQLAAAIATFRAQGKHLPKVGRVHTRVARLGECLIVDLGTPDGQVVEVSADGWRLLAGSPVPFRRGPSYASLPLPERGGTLDDLRAVFQMPEPDFAVVLGFVLSTFMPEGPFPVLNLTGPSGAGKSKLTEMIKAFTDPGSPALRRLPGSEADLFKFAQGNHVLAFENVSAISHGMSDALCSISTGSGFAKPLRGAHGEEVVLHACCPVILNGVGGAVTKGDLMQRVWQVDLAPFGHPDHQDHAQALRSSFPAHGAKAFGVILDMLAAGLRTLPSVKACGSTRMIKAATWVEACTADIGWKPGQFMTHLDGLARDGAEVAVDGNFLLRGLVTLLEKVGVFVGTMTEMLKAAAEISPDAAKQFPKPNKVGPELDRHSQTLQRLGVSYAKVKGSLRDGRRYRFELSLPVANSVEPQPEPGSMETYLDW